MALLVTGIIFGSLIAAGLVYYFFLAEKGDRYSRALQLAAKGNYTDARAMVRTQLSRDPKNAEAHYTMSRIYSMEGDQDSEIEHLDEILKGGLFTNKIHPERIMTRIADIHYEKGRYRESFIKYKEVLAQNKRNEEALARLAFMAIGQGEWEIAEYYFKDLVNIEAERADYHIGRGVGLAMLRKSDAIKELEEGLRLQPDDKTAQFLTALQCLKQGYTERADELIDQVIADAQDPGLKCIAYRLKAASSYLNGSYTNALDAAEKCLSITLEQGWKSEEYDARLTVSYMAMILGDLEKSNDQLLELEVENPNDELVIRVSDFRMDLEEGIATTDDISPRGFDFKKHLKEWASNRFPDQAIYNLSGLEMEETIDFSGILQTSSEGSGEKKKAGGQNQVDPSELIEKFNQLTENQFQEACKRIIESQGYKINKALPKKDKDGADFIATLKEDKKVKALFSIRQWANQPISDIFLRNLQNNMNELKVVQGFVIAGASLTPGAESALQNLKKIKVINESDLGVLLKQVMN